MIGTFITNSRRQADYYNETFQRNNYRPRRFYPALKTGRGQVDEHVAVDNLVLKIGDPVIYERNQFGEIFEMDDDFIVMAVSKTRRIDIVRRNWKTYEYVRTTKQERRKNPYAPLFKQQVAGECQQFPLKLAYSVSIYDVLDMKFDVVEYDNARFTNHRLITAMNCCKSLEGFSCRNFVNKTSFSIDSVVRKFHDTVCSDLRYLAYYNRISREPIDEEQVSIDS